VKLYLVQDFEPNFYAKEQPEYDLANATYDLGLSAIALGNYLKGILQQRGRLTRSIPFEVVETFHAAGRQRRFQNRASGCSVLFFARPDIPRRNFSVGVEALAALSRAFPGVVIKLYGLEKKLDLPFAYKHLGQLAQSQLAAEMAKSDIHLSYSLTNVSAVIYEAMACGCACIEADVESVRGMVESGVNCLLTEPNATATFSALSNLVQDSELRLGIAQKGLAFAKEMTEVRMCEEFMRAVLESALVM
jgi:glycosyltransferase involved in cell wall biosynthesis